MNAQDKTEEQSMNELENLRRRVSELEASEARFKRTEKLLRDSEERFRLLYENTPLAYQSLDENGHVLEVNQAWLETFGYSREEVIGKWVGDFLTAPFREKFLIYFPQFKAVGKIHGIEFEIKGQSGSVITVAVDGRIGYDEHGRFKQTHCILHDITEPKKSERELQRSNDLLRAIIEAAPTPIIGLDLDGNVQMVWNPAAEKMLGWSAHEVMGRPLPSVPAESSEEFRGFRERIRKGMTMEGVEVCRQRRDGTLIDYSIYASPLHDAQGRISGNIAVLVDITERKQAEAERERLQAQLLHAQKMEAIGTLAGGIAHDFNNLLQVTIGYSEVLLSRRDETDPEYARLHQILQAGRSGAELVQRLLTLSRKTESKQRPMDLNDQIRQAKRLLDRTIPKMIKIELFLSDLPARVNADPTQIDQIVVNLAVNARDAMPDGGMLTISTENVWLDEKYCRMHPGANSGSHVVLTVSDTGSGMNQDTLGHIFEPFFTTKGVGRGTGLGLAVVYGIVKQHGGHVTCDSEPGCGTVFRIYLPAIEQQDIISGVAAEEPERLGGTETILLVDDEEVVRDFGELILRESGYKVLAAKNAEEALELYSKQRGNISLVILDLIMPGMGGMECLKKLRRIDPQVKVIVASGYSEDASVKVTIQAGAKSFVTKPFRGKGLLGDVRRVLDGG